LRIGAGRLHHLSLVTAFERHRHVWHFDTALKSHSVAQLLVNPLVLWESVLRELLGLGFDASFPALFRICTELNLIAKVRPDVGCHALTLLPATLEEVFMGKWSILVGWLHVFEFVSLLRKRVFRVCCSMNWRCRLERLGT
jgi:hypothetical protein